MELALYCPVYGYYEKEGDKIGRSGDFYTSVSVGSLFGELLGCQFASWFKSWAASKNCAVLRNDCQSPGHPEGRRSRLRLIEGGAHGGQLAADILRWMRQFEPEVFRELEYWLVEPSSHRRESQRRTLSEFAGKVHWSQDFEKLAESLNPQGMNATWTIIFSNELLDALPTHRFGWDAHERTWFEWGVGYKEGQFHWSRLVRPSSPLPGPSPLVDALPEGFIVETCPAATRWWTQAAGLLCPGKLVTFDYGFTTEERLAPERSRGTLRGYQRHGLTADVLQDPGEHDMTTHVDFDALEAAGQAAGLKTELFSSQERFLTGIVGEIVNGNASFSEWTAERTRQFQTLTHPDHLGRAFRVLIQSRD